jgi:hypothetical protein
VAAEGRDISDIMADAFNLYLSRSKFKTAINAFLSAQETK